MGDGEPKELTTGRLFVLLSGIASAAVVVALYHCIAVGWCKRRRRGISQNEEQEESGLENTGLEHSMVELIPAYKYDREAGLIGEDGTCAVCLSEYLEGEQLRTLPDCMHSFHAPCIDMWLYSHTSCPLCRADMIPSSQIMSSMLNSGMLTSPTDSVVSPSKRYLVTNQNILFKEPTELTRKLRSC